MSTRPEIEKIEDFLRRSRSFRVLTLRAKLTDEVGEADSCILPVGYNIKSIISVNETFILARASDDESNSRLVMIHHPSEDYDFQFTKYNHFYNKGFAPKRIHGSVLDPQEQPPFSHHETFLDDFALVAFEDSLMAVEFFNDLKKPDFKDVSKKFIEYVKDSILRQSDSGIMHGNIQLDTIVIMDNLSGVKHLGNGKIESIRMDGVRSIRDYHLLMELLSLSQSLLKINDPILRQELKSSIAESIVTNVGKKIRNRFFSDGVSVYENEKRIPSSIEKIRNFINGDVEGEKNVRDNRVIEVFTAFPCIMTGVNAPLSDIGFITPRSIKTVLDKKGWLDDNAVNGYMDLLQKKVRDDRVLILSSLEVESSSDSLVSEKSLRMREMESEDIEFLIIPVNFNKNHWIFLFVNLRDKFVGFFDSLLGEHESKDAHNHLMFDTLKRLSKGVLGSRYNMYTQYYNEHSKYIRKPGMNVQKKNAPTVSMYDDGIRQHGSDEGTAFRLGRIASPQQEDTCSCGIFVILVTRFIIHRYTKNMSNWWVIRNSTHLRDASENIPQYRQGIAHELITGRFC